MNPREARVQDFYDFSWKVENLFPDFKSCLVMQMGKVVNTHTVLLKTILSRSLMEILTKIPESSLVFRICISNVNIPRKNFYDVLGLVFCKTVF